MGIKGKIILLLVGDLIDYVDVRPFLQHCRNCVDPTLFTEDME